MTGTPSKEGQTTRPPWDEYFMGITELVAGRSTCMRRKVGALVVKDRNILATGYNGAPSGVTHCIETGCLREEMGVPSGERHEICRGLHAEQNAIIQAARHGISIKGAIIYSTTMPCVMCTKMIINASISRVYYLEGYPDKLTASFFDESAIPLVQISRRSPEDVP